MSRTEYLKQYYIKNKDKNKEYKKKHYQANKDKYRDSDKRWRIKNPEKSRKCQRENWAKNRKKYIEMDLLKNYGITLEQKQAMIIKQNNKCAICDNPFKNDRHRNVDHNHSTGQIREVLCSRCNLVLGSCCDDKELLKKMIVYLTKWS